LKPDDSRKDNIEFVVGEWDNARALKSAKGYTSSGHILIFEVWNDPRSLNLFIGPGDEKIRQQLLEMVRVNHEVFREPRKVSGKWLLVFTRPLLKQEAYEDFNQEEREQEIQRQWGQVLHKDLPRIEAALKEET
jgi:hypothetical protein